MSKLVCSSRDPKPNWWPGWRLRCRVDCEARRERVVALRGAIDDLLVERLPFLKGLLFLLDQLAQGCSDGLRSGPSKIPVGIHQVGTPILPLHVFVPLRG